MKHKLFIRGMSLLLVLAQWAFVFGQNAPNNSASNNALIDLLDEPDAVAVVNVKKIVTQTAPSIFGSDPAALGKLKDVMKTIESDTGVNPLLLEKLILGVKIGSGAAGSPMLVLQSSEQSAQLLEKMYQARLTNARFAREINPLKNRLETVERRIESLKDGLLMRNSPDEDEAARLKKFQTALEAVKPSRAEQTRVAKLKTDAGNLFELYKTYQELEPSVYDPGDLPERVAAVRSEIEDISASDPQRAARIAGAEKLLAEIEKLVGEKRRRITVVDNIKDLNGFTMNSFSEFPAEFPADAAARKAEFERLQTAVTEQTSNLNTLIDAINSKELPPDSPSETGIEEETSAYPIEVAVSRKDETLGGKKLVLIKTVSKYPENSFSLTDEEEVAVLLYDEKTIVFGDRASVAQTLEKKAVNANQIAKDLVGRTPDALAVFGVDLRNVDISELADVFGGQKNVWQIVGSIDSTGSDISLTAAFEKTDAPYNYPAVKKETAPAVTAPKPPGGSAASELMELLIKSVVGIEGKITIRFDKQKTAGLIEKTPGILTALLKR
jgi:hypothetical protein